MNRCITHITILAYKLPNILWRVLFCHHSFSFSNTFLLSSSHSLFLSLSLSFFVSIYLQIISVSRNPFPSLEVLVLILMLPVMCVTLRHLSSKYNILNATIVFQDQHTLLGTDAIFPPSLQNTTQQQC